VPELSIDAADRVSAALGGNRPRAATDRDEDLSWRSSARSSMLSAPFVARVAERGAEPGVAGQEREGGAPAQPGYSRWVTLTGGASPVMRWRCH